MNINGVISYEKHTMQAFRIKLEASFTNGHDFCELIIDEAHNSFTARLYGGEVYTYAWSAPGDDFIKFLIRTLKESHYLYSKLADLSLEEFIDTEKTAEAMRKKILEKRRKQACTENEARAAWEFAESIESHNSPTKESFYLLYSTEGMGEIFEEEFWYEDSIISKDDRKCRIFCELVAPILSDALAYEFAPRYTPHGGRPTVLEELLVGTKFHVCNGAWNGEIAERDGKKVIDMGANTYYEFKKGETLDLIILEDSL